MPDNASMIVSARHWLVKMPFADPIEWGSGSRDGTTRLVVELTTADGVRGYGETICLLDFIRPVLEKCVLPLAEGKSVFDSEILYRQVLGAGYYHHKRAAVMALSAVDMAMWDAAGKIAGLPLHDLWGGAYRREVVMTAYLFIHEPDELARRAREFQALGYRAFKVKIGLDPEQDIATVAAARESLGADAHLRADVNGAWTIGTAKRQLARLAPYHLAFIEQPLELDDLVGSAELRRAGPTPIALDESAYTLSDVANIIRACAADIVLLDPHEQGGLKQCLKAAALCEAFNIPVTLHSGGELGFSQAAYLHLAAACPNMTLSVDTEHAYLTDDVITEPFQIRDGVLTPPSGPGLGVTADVNAIERYVTDEITGAYPTGGWFSTKPAY